MPSGRIMCAPGRTRCQLCPPELQEPPRAEPATLLPAFPAPPGASVAAPAVLGCTFLTFRLCPVTAFGDGNPSASALSPAPPSVTGTCVTPPKCEPATVHGAESCCFCGPCPCSSAAVWGALGLPAAVGGRTGGVMAGRGWPGARSDSVVVGWRRGRAAQWDSGLRGPTRDLI